MTIFPEIRSVGKRLGTISRQKNRDRQTDRQMGMRFVTLKLHLASRFPLQ